jgi:hypothetical protein
MARCENNVHTESELPLGRLVVNSIFDKFHRVLLPSPDAKAIARNLFALYLFPVKTLVREPQQYVVDARGKRVAVMLDIATYDQLVEAAEEANCIRAYDAAKPVVEAELKAGRFSTLQGAGIFIPSKRILPSPPRLSPLDLPDQPVEPAWSSVTNGGTPSVLSNRCSICE